MSCVTDMEMRPLGRTGLKASAIGITLPPDPAIAEALTRRGAAEGITFFAAADPAALASALDALGERPEALVAYGPRNGAYLLQHATGDRPQAGLGLEVRAASELPPEPSCIFAPFNLVEQDLSRELFPRAAKSGHGIVATRVLGGGALAGPVGHAPPGAAVTQFRSLVKPRRTLAQAALLFAMANQYVSCALAGVSSVEHLMEAVRAADAEPLTVSDLESVFEAWANRYDRK